MKKILFMLAMTMSSQVMAAEVVKNKDGTWGCVEGGELIKSGEGGFWASNYPLRDGDRCAALSLPLPLRELKKGEEPTWLIFNRKGEQGRGGEPKANGF